MELVFLALTKVGSSSMEWQKSYQHFSSVSEALKSSKFKSGVDGVGITLPFNQYNLWLVVIDIDDIDLETEQNKGWIKDLNNRFGRCYTEYSLSGRGIHFVCWTTEPLEQKSFTQPNGAIIEIFCKSPKWVAITTDYFFQTSEREIIPDCTRELIKFYDEQTELGKAEQKSATIQQIFPTTPYLHTNNIKVQEGERNNTLTKALGNICSQAESLEEVIEKANNWNQKSCIEPLADNEVAKTSESIWKAEQEKRRAMQIQLAQIEKGEIIRPTDEGNCDVLANITDGNLKYISENKCWIVWNEVKKMWAKDELNTLKKQFTNEVSNYWRKRTIEASTKSEINMLSKFADRCQSDRDIKNYLNRAKEDPRFAISFNEVDNDINVFAVANGVIDLNVDLTKETPFRPSNKKEILFHKSPVKFDPEAKAPRWDEFIQEICSEPDGLDLTGKIKFKRRKSQEDYLKRFLAYLLTGDVSEQKILFLTGTGSNGKSVLIEVIQFIWGDYCEAVPANIFMAQKFENSGANPYEAKLKGKRIAYCEEATDRQSINTALVKKHSGGGTLCARFMYQNPVSFQVTHTVLLATNSIPSLDNLDNAMKGRLHVVPFDMSWNRPSEISPNPSYPDADPQLAKKLKEEAAGILNSLIEAYTDYKYHTKGLHPPESVTKHTEGYFQDQDTVFNWLKENTKNCLHSNGEILTELYENYEQFIKDEADSKDRISKVTFGKDLKERGFSNRKIKNQKRWNLTTDLTNFPQDELDEIQDERERD